MKRLKIMSAVILFLAAVAALPGLWGVAFAATPLEPVQYVYPDSTLEEIQQAIDTGGTVYFDRLTKHTRQYGEYNQVASRTPDLAPTPDNPAQGFNIGKHGKAVRLIGLLGPWGERPKINGGTATFRVGRFPSLGFAGAPVSFRLENLEIHNPDLGGPQALYSRIGLWVNMLGAQSIINNCQFTVTGKDSDPGHVNNHSTAIWFLLQASQPQSPPSGARIDVTNNTIVATKVHEGLHVDSFWPDAPGFTPPRVFVSNNTVIATNLRGFANKSGTNGATLNTAILVGGNLPNSIVTNNIIRGNGRSPGLTPEQESVAIGLMGAGSVGMDSANLTVLGNDSSSFAADFQLWMETIVSDSTTARNFLGPASKGGVMCRGRDNWFDQNHFFGDYPGWEFPASGPGLFWFAKTSRGNLVVGTRLNAPPYWYDMCGQLWDETGGDNRVPGFEECQKR